MIIAGPHSSSFTFLWGGVIVYTPPIANGFRVMITTGFIGSYTQN